ncbi:DUF222 domain-containing protein [Brachybacterium huguangmaarense]
MENTRRGRAEEPADKGRQPGAPDRARLDAPVRMVQDEALLVDGVDLLALAQAAARVALDAGPALRGIGEGALAARELSEVLAGIDRLRSALGALEMRALVGLDAAIRSEDAAAGLTARDRGRRTASEVSLASRTSPARAGSRLRTAHRLTADMPGVFTALAHGRLSLETAQTIGRAVGPLSPETRTRADALIADRLPDLAGAGARQWEREVSALAQALDPGGAPERHRTARLERHVTIVPGAHGMARLSAVLPALDAAAIRRRLARDAERLHAQGDRRTSAQIASDLLCDTLLGREGGMETVQLEVGVVISDGALLSPAHGEPATIEGFGAIPPFLVRDELIRRFCAGQFNDAPVGAGRLPDTGPPPDGPRGFTTLTPTASGAAPPGPAQHQESAQEHAPTSPSAPDPEARSAADPPLTDETMTLLRRLFAHPTTGQLVAVESRARAFPAGLARYLRLRDVSCRTPYCDASIRHLDHVRPWAEGGATSAANGEGLCAHCNLVKELLGTVTPVGGGHASGTETDAGDPRALRWESRLGLTATTTPTPLTGLPIPSMPAGIVGAPMVPDAFGHGTAGPDGGLDALLAWLAEELFRATGYDPLEPDLGRGDLVPAA